MDGLNILINIFDSQLMKDELSDILEEFKEFEDFQRTSRQSMTAIIATFDSRYRNIEKKINMKLPSEILVFKLLRNASISNEDKMPVLL